MTRERFPSRLLYIYIYIFSRRVRNSVIDSSTILIQQRKNINDSTKICYQAVEKRLFQHGMWFLKALIIYLAIELRVKFAPNNNLSKSMLVDWANWNPEFLRDCARFSGSAPLNGWWVTPRVSRLIAHLSIKRERANNISNEFESLDICLISNDAQSTRTLMYDERYWI